MTPAPGHGLDLTRPRWDSTSGALELWCECGLVLRDFPPSPYAYDSRLAAMEADQIRAFRRHLEEVGR